MNRNSAALVSLVVAGHLFFFFFDFKKAPHPSPKRPIAIRTVSLCPPIQTQLTSSSPSIQSFQQRGEGYVEGKRQESKSALSTNHLSHPKPRTPSRASAKKREILKKVEQSLKKMGEALPFEEKKEALIPPLRLSDLKIEQKHSTEIEGYLSLLTRSLQEGLALPEQGNVKLALTIRKSGSVLKLNVLESASDLNRAYLECYLLKMTFPPFSDDLKQENERTWIVTFCNET